MIRKLYIIIMMALVALTGFAQQTGDVIYVYQKDGEIQTFLRSEITEFYYGFEDEDGVTHNDLQMQWIVLEDSICKIPLANIDSISFVTPPTVFQPGVTVIEQSLMQYVESSDSLTIQFASNTPANLLPKVGEVIATAEMNEKFPIGFMGKVKKVSGTTIECDAINYEDAFKTLYSINIVKADTIKSSDVRRRAIDWNKDARVTLPTWNIDFSPEAKSKIASIEDLSFKGGIKAVMSISPEFYIKAALIINEQQGFNFSADIIGNYDLQETLGLYGGLEFNHDFELPQDPVKVSLGYGVCFYLNFGAFLRASATLSLANVWTQHFRSQTSFRFGSKWKDEPKISHDFTQTKSNHDVVGCIDGSVMAGGFAELGLTFLDRHLDKLMLRGEFGIEGVGHFVFLNSEIVKAKNQTKYYEMLKNSEVDLNYFANATIQAELGTLNYTQNTPYNYTFPLAKWNLVPSFYRTEFEQCYSPRNAADARVRASGNLIDDVNVGFKVYTVKGEEVGTYVFDDYYKKGEKQFGNRFEGLDMNEDYRVYPVVRINDVYDILASPSVLLEKSPFPVTIVDFKQTGSHYSKQKGYEYDGRNYFYKFNATTTVELSEDAKDIKDWGYIYHDIYGEDKKISCANLGGRNYPDTRYAYYYNEPYRTVELYPYVQYEGETEIQKGKTPKTYEVEYTHVANLSCPDNNHPHAIDLGLPSRTLWACCNVGASDPEDHGEHYAWGMTTNVVGEQYPLGRTLWGLDIAGTRYDVAHEKWGGAWSMPTKAQMQELMDYCSSEFSIIGSYDNGGGVRFTGPNGKSILLVAAGMLNNIGTEEGVNDCDKAINISYSAGYAWQPEQDVDYHYDGHYWTSTDTRGLEFDAYYWFRWLYTDDTYTTLNRYEMYASYYQVPNLSLGNLYHKTSDLRFSVRPVMKKK